MKNILRAVTLLAFCAIFHSVSAQPGCPAVSTAASVIIPCGQTCATLNATAFSGAQTTDYAPSIIPYTPPFPFNVGTAVLVATDDLWSDVIPLPFNFCFFGNVYNNIVVGSNGVVSFNTGNANGFNSWSITGAMPANAPTDMYNSISGPWQDMDPTNQGQIHYQIGGTFPCRYFEVSWSAVPMYGDPASVNTAYCSTVANQNQQIVIYETTNAIEVYIQEKDVPCNDLGNGYWNGGLAYEGLINAAGTTAIPVPGRNSTQWSAINDAYRFTPTGPANYTISWLANNGAPIGSGASIQVCPPDTGTYTAVATYTNCDNSTVVVSSTIFVGIGTLHTHIDSIHQPSCFGDSGAIYASFTSSTPVTSFGWNVPGGAGQLSITNQPAGTYIFTATDSTGCTKSDTVTLVNPRPLQVRVNDTTVVGCNNSVTGALIAIIAGGTPGYTYNWTGNGTTDTISGLSAGAYTVTVTDSKSCSATATGNVFLSISAPVFAQPVITGPLCNGGSNGEIIVNVTGGRAPISYNWSGTTSSTDSAINLSAGTYGVTATDSVGCTATATYTVTQPSHINIDSSHITPVSCSVQGAVFVRDTGGTGVLTYNWSTGTSGDSIVNVLPGTYILTVTDANGCGDTSSFTVGTGPGAIAFGPPIIENDRCNADSTGSIIVTTTGGIGNVTYLWSYNNDSTAQITGLPTGTYTVTATDSVGCSVSTSYTINQPNAVTIASDSIKNVSCNGGSDGCITITAAGGTGGYFYNWTNSDTLNRNCGLTAGTYGVTVTDQSGCSTTASYTITEPTPLVIDLTLTTQATCSVGGSIIIVASGGTGILTYTWSNLLTGDTLTNLAGGPITVTITDQNGCSLVANDTIGAAPGVVVFGSPTITNLSCNGDSTGCITATASGGNGPIVFHWSTGDSVATICGLRAGPYSVTITDSVGCSASTTYVINQPAPVTFNAPIIVNASCSGGNNGCITVSATGGTPVYHYRWNTGDSTATVCGLTAGSYTVTATDTLGCTGTATYTVGQANPIVFGQPVFTNIRCNGDSTGGINVTASGGTGPITFVWSNNDSTAVLSGVSAGTYSVTATDSVGCSASFSYTLTQPTPVKVDSSVISPVTCATGGCIYVYASGGTGTLGFSWSNNAVGDTVCSLTAGNYFVTISDQNGCTATDSFTVGTALGVVTFGPDTIVNVLCNGGNTGSIKASATGGTGPITFLWSYQNATTATISGLIAGSYSVTITDSLGCSASATYTVTQPNPIVITPVSITQATCSAGGCIIVTSTGGTGSITYHWSNLATGDTVCNLSAGPITVGAIDSNNCTATAQFNITSASGITFGNPVFGNINCFGGNTGSITVTTNGGTGTVHYHWSYQNDSTATITGLAAGTYTVTASDSVGCSASFSYTLNQPTQIIIDTVRTIPATCSTGGCIVVSATGGTGNITYSWQGGATGDSVCGLPAGPITVTATDQNGCTATATYNIATAPGSLTFNAPVIVDARCNGDSTGSITVSTSSTAPVVYQWSYQNASTATITGLPAGTYTVTATVGGTCSASASYTVGEPPVLSAPISFTQQICFLANDGSATVIPTGGTPGYTYHWNNNTTNATDTGLTQGTVTVTVTDSKGCAVTASATITQRPQLNSTVIGHDNHCHIPAYGNAEIHTTGGVAPLTFHVPGYTDVVVTEVGADTVAYYDSLPAGQYPVTITDSVGCTSTNVIFIQSSVADVVTSATDSATCNGASDGSIIVTPHDTQNGPFGYSLNGGTFQTDSIFTGLAAGVYNVVVSNSYGCQSSYSDTVGQPAPGTITPSPDLIDTVLNALVSIQLTTSGINTPVYSWSPADGLSCDNCPIPTVTVVGPATYIVTVSDSLNKQCAVVDTVIITPKGLFQMPNAFTPNGDGKNDEFGPISFSYATVKSFRIYNRWGQCIHNSTALWDGKFDGKEQPAGTYLYYIEADHYDKYDYSKVVTEKMEGTVTLLR